MDDSFLCLWLASSIRLSACPRTLQYWSLYSALSKTASDKKIIPSNRSLQRQGSFCTWRVSTIQYIRPRQCRYSHITAYGKHTYQCFCERWNSTWDVLLCKSQQPRADAHLKICRLVIKTLHTDWQKVVHADLINQCIYCTSPGIPSWLGSATPWQQSNSPMQAWHYTATSLKTILFTILHVLAEWEVEPTWPTVFWAQHPPQRRASTAAATLLHTNPVWAFGPSATFSTLS